MAEVGEADDDLPADSGQGTEETGRLEDLLQGLAEDHVVETAVGIVLDLGVQIALQDAEAPAMQKAAFSLSCSMPVPITCLVGGKPGQQVAVAAAEIEDPAALFDPSRR